LKVRTPPKLNVGQLGCHRTESAFSGDRHATGDSRKRWAARADGDRAAAVRAKRPVAAIASGHGPDSDAGRTGPTASAGVASPSLTTEYTPEEVDDLVAPMDEREVRALFIEQLKADAGGWPAMVRGIGVLLMLATAGLIAQRSISRQLPAITAKLSAAAMDHWLGRAGCLLARLLMEAASVGVFAPPARVSSASPSALALKNWSRISSRESFS
jgi:hypothetical protein